MPIANPPVRRPLAVVTTMTRWDEPPRIRHQVTRQLARFYNVLYVELPFVAERPAEETSVVDANLTVFKPRSLGRLARRLRNNLRIARRRHDAILVRAIERRAREMGYTSAALVNFQFDFDAIMGSALFDRKIYLCNDEFQDATRFWVRALNRNSEDAVIRTADVSLAVSLPLLEKLQRISSRAELFLPGHEFEAEASPDVRARSEPIQVCYMGFVNSRLQVSWLERLARDPDVHITLIGPVENPADWASLLARSNVSHAGAMVGAVLQAALSAADVFVMPYDVNQQAVRAITAPNKLFQYLACGRPVVSSNLPRLISLPEHFVYVSADAEAFVAAVRRAFREDSAAHARERVSYAALNTWSARGETLRNLIDRAAVH
jgi:glycosyltransferase involved in cell wall biosynthesis